MSEKKGGILTYFFAAVFIVVFLFPFYVEISTAPKNPAELFTFPVTWWSTDPNWSLIVEIWDLVPLGKYYTNTYTVILATVALNFFVATPAAYALSTLDFPCKKAISYLTLVSQMFIPVLVVLPIFNFIKNIGLIDSLAGLVLVNSAFSVAFVTLLMKGFFDTIPKEIEEAALIDGCKRFETLYKIYLPICLSGVVVALIYNAILVNNEFLFANTMIMDNNKQLMSVALYRLIQGNPYSWEITWNHLMMAALFAALPIQILFLFIHKYLAKGLVSGAIK